MYRISAFVFLLSLLSLASSQSYSFGLGVDNPEQFASSAFSFQPTFASTSSRASSRGASRTASGSAAGRTTSQTDQKSPGHSISSFIFSGLDDLASTQQQTPRRPQQQFQSQPQQQRRQQQQFQPQPEPQQQPSRNTQRQRQWATPAPEENEINELTIGKSPCARGAPGHECRLHLMATAKSCTSGKCYECQQCGAVAARDWITCCRDHFLCCRPLARSCQRCDQPSIAPFCNIAFGKCH